MTYFVIAILGTWLIPFVVFYWGFVGCRKRLL